MNIIKICLILQNVKKNNMFGFCSENVRFLFSFVQLLFRKSPDILSNSLKISKQN